MNINLNISLWQVFGMIVVVCLMISYLFADTHPVSEVVVPMVDPAVPSHHEGDIPVLDEDGL